MKKYMVVEKFKADCFDAVYERFKVQGRMLPPGLYYLNSWVSEDNNICFQLMETMDKTLFEQWTSHWRDLTDFEIIEID